MKTESRNFNKQPSFGTWLNTPKCENILRDKVSSERIIKSILFCMTKADSMIPQFLTPESRPFIGSRHDRFSLLAQRSFHHEVIRNFKLPLARRAERNRRRESEGKWKMENRALHRKQKAATASLIHLLGMMATFIHTKGKLFCFSLNEKEIRKQPATGKTGAKKLLTRILAAEMK